MLYMSEVGSGKAHEVFEKVYQLKLEEKTNADYKGSQSGGETAFGRLKIQIDDTGYNTFTFFRNKGQGIRQESIVTGSIQIEILELFLEPDYGFRGRSVQYFLRNK